MLWLNDQGAISDHEVTFKLTPERWDGASQPGGGRRQTGRTSVSSKPKMERSLVGEQKRNGWCGAGTQWAPFLSMPPPARCGQNAISLYHDWLYTSPSSVHPNFLPRIPGGESQDRLIRTSRAERAASLPLLCHGWQIWELSKDILTRRVMTHNANFPSVFLMAFGKTV